MIVFTALSITPIKILARRNPTNRPVLHVYMYLVTSRKSKILNYIALKKVMKDTGDT